MEAAASEVKSCVPPVKQGAEDDIYDKLVFEKGDYFTLFNEIKQRLIKVAEYKDEEKKSPFFILQKILNWRSLQKKR